jgi:hypothetical protein
MIPAHRAASSSESATLADLFLHSPTYEFRWALDRAAASLSTAAPALAVVSSPFYTVELLRRAGFPLHLASRSEFNLTLWLRQAAPWAWQKPKLVDLSAPASYSALLWAEPEAGAAPETAKLLRQRALPGARLQVIASTDLRRYLPAWRLPIPPAQAPLPVAAVLRLLRAAGWQVESLHGYHGPRAVAWTNLARLCQALGRPDWADRAGFAMRASYIEQGLLCKITPLLLISCCPA